MSTLELGWMLAWAYIAGGVCGYWFHTEKPQHPVIEDQMRKKFAHSSITEFLDKPLDPPVLYDMSDPLDAQVHEVKMVLGI